MVALTWLFSIVGVLGVVGTIAAFILVPAVAMPILQNTVTWLLACKRCLVALAFVTVAFVAFWGGHHKAVLDCRASELAAQLAAKQADLEHAHQAAADETIRANTIEAIANDQRSKDAVYIATLEARPACALDDADLGGLPNHKPRLGRAKPSAGSR